VLADDIKTVENNQLLELIHRGHTQPSSTPDNPGDRRHVWQDQRQLLCRLSGTGRDFLSRNPLRLRLARMPGSNDLIS
jgi:hypothetical protein